jgi:hypothetical protein
LDLSAISAAVNRRGQISERERRIAEDAQYILLGGSAPKGMKMPRSHAAGIKRKQQERERRAEQAALEQGLFALRTDKEGKTKRVGLVLDPKVLAKRAVTVESVAPEVATAKRLAGNRRGDTKIIDGLRGPKFATGHYEDGVLHVRGLDWDPSKRRRRQDHFSPKHAHRGGAGKRGGRGGHGVGKKR